MLTSTATPMMDVVHAERGAVGLDFAVDKS